MKRASKGVVFVFAAFLGVTQAALAAAPPTLDAAAIAARELGLSKADAAACLDLLDEQIGDFLAKGARVAFDGFGAFEPAYGVDDETGKAFNTARFVFNTGPAVEHPALPTVFDEDFAAAIFSKITNEGPARGLRIKIELGACGRLLDVYVFCVLRNTDNLTRHDLGDWGRFYPTPKVDLSTTEAGGLATRDVTLQIDTGETSEARNASYHEYELSVLSTGIAVLGKEGARIRRVATRLGSPELTVTAGLLEEAVAKLQDGYDDAAGTKAQDHNSSRSNKTASVISDVLDTLGEANDSLKKVSAQDHNSSRSNKTASIIDDFTDEGEIVISRLRTGARDYNASSSSRTESAYFAELLGTGEGSTKAQDHNSSRSNKTASIVVDFDPGDGLIRRLNAESPR